MKSNIFAILAAGALLTGCATTAPMQSKFPNAQLVGGGLFVEWEAPANGTVILAEASSGKIIRTESLKSGDRFSFNPVEQDNVYVLNRLFNDGPQVAESSALLPLPRNAKFVLYFVPLDGASSAASVAGR